MKRTTVAAIALGSNLGDRAGRLRAAVEEVGKLRQTRVVRVSRFIETAPVRVAEADPGGAFLNGAMLVETGLGARGLLLALHEIERAAGRDRTQARGGPRPLDLDLLVYGDEVIEEAGLRVPHPRLHERAFVLEPLAEIAPELVVPRAGAGLGVVRDGLPPHSSGLEHGVRGVTVGALWAALRGASAEERA